MHKIFALLCGVLFAALFTDVSAQQNMFEWKGGAVTVRSASAVDSVTFSVGDWLYDVSCSSAVGVTTSSFTAVANVSLGKGVKSVSEQPTIGICYSTKNAEPTIEDDRCYSLGSQLQSYTFTIEGLLSGNKYYYRTYVKLLNDVYYSDVYSITVLGEKTEDKSCTINGHKFVDLGLSVLWAETNVGAETASDYGNYYAWGETETKTDYDWDTYKWASDTRYKYIKYTVDSKRTLDAEDDVATANWGVLCRMPSAIEFDELNDTCNCVWKWATENGIDGYKVTSKKTGNSIFLPASGYCEGEGFSHQGDDGYYWSNSLSRIYSDYAQYQYFTSTFRDLGACFRYYGLPVRPVAEK